MAPPDMAPPRWPGGALLACRAHLAGSGRAHRRRPHGPPVIYRHTRGSARRSCRPRVHGPRTGTVTPRAPAARQPHVRTWLRGCAAVATGWRRGPHGSRTCGHGYTGRSQGAAECVGLRARSLARRTLGSARHGTHALGRFGPRICPLAPPPLLAPTGGPRTCGHDSAGGGPCQPSAAARPHAPPDRLTCNA